MTLKTTMAADLAAVHLNTDEFADAITYDGASINAIVDYLENPVMQNDGTVIEAVITVSAADVADPDEDYRTEVVIGSKTWLVKGVVGGCGQTWDIGLFRDERPVL